MRTTRTKRKNADFKIKKLRLSASSVRVVRVPFNSFLHIFELFFLGTDDTEFHGFSAMITQNSRVNPCIPCLKYIPFCTVIS